jgi:hypothetical protein
MPVGALTLKAFVYCLSVCAGVSAAMAQPAPVPLLDTGHPVNWWFVFKFNAAAFPACGGAARQCRFGGDVQPYASFGQQYAVASSEEPSLVKGGGCAGDSTADPIGATFDQVYNGSYSYVVWNDQFYGDPHMAICTGEDNNCGGTWGHSKGMLAWNANGEGMVLQVTTPSWPAAGSSRHPRTSDGNTLGCVRDDNVMVSQHFFALKLNKDDVVKVLTGLANASVVTDPANLQVVSSGGPPDLQALVATLGRKSTGVAPSEMTLSSGVTLISKPSRLHVPPWQLVSATLGGVPLRTATWWTGPTIGSTDGGTTLGCWDDILGHAGVVEIATSGRWQGSTFGLTGGPGRDFNHAKLGVSLAEPLPYAIFGDLNQQGSWTPRIRPCTSSQNARGGLFYVVPNPQLAASLRDLLTGGTAPADTP